MQHERLLAAVRVGCHLAGEADQEEGPVQVVVDGHQQEVLAEDVHVLRSTLLVSPFSALLQNLS